LGKLSVKLLTRIGVSILGCYLLVVIIALVIRPGFKDISPDKLAADFPVVILWAEAESQHCQIIYFREYENPDWKALNGSLQLDAASAQLCQQNIVHLEEHGDWPVSHDMTSGSDAFSSERIASLESTFQSNNTIVLTASLQTDSYLVNQSRYTVTDNNITHAEYKAYDSRKVALSVFLVIFALFVIFMIVYGLTKALMKLDSLEK